MPIPPYTQNIALEEALAQFHFAAEELALRPCLKTALDAFIASGRYKEAILKGQEKKIPYQKALRYIRDYNNCKALMKKIQKINSNIPYWMRLMEMSLELIMEYMEKPWSDLDSRLFSDE